MSQPDLHSGPSAAPGDFAATEAWPLGARVPHTNSRLLRRIGSTVLRLSGWRRTGQFPDASRFVVVVAPHTSNWDFLVLLMAKWALCLDVRWMGKDAIFQPPLGWFMRRIGGIPIRRTAAHNVVDRSVQAFADRTKLVLVLAPEGTRKFVAHWKSGFWHIARGANVPVVCVALDYRRREVRLGPVFDLSVPATPSELHAIPLGHLSAEDGIARIRASYDGVQGFHPSQHS